MFPITHWSETQRANVGSSLDDSIQTLLYRDSSSDQRMPNSPLHFVATAFHHWWSESSVVTLEATICTGALSHNNQAITPVQGELDTPYVLSDSRVLRLAVTLWHQLWRQASISAQLIIIRIRQTPHHIIYSTAEYIHRVTSELPGARIVNIQGREYSDSEGYPGETEYKYLPVHTQSCFLFSTSSANSTSTATDTTQTDCARHILYQILTILRPAYYYFEVCTLGTHSGNEDIVTKAHGTYNIEF